MLSGKFKSIPIDEITVTRETRQRRVIEVEDLVESIAAIGLINPITVDREHVLIAGERRYTACKELGWTSIPVQYIEDASESDRHLIELEENIKRQELPWADYVEAMANYIKLKGETQENYTIEKGAQDLGVAESTVKRVLAVKRELERGTANVVNAAGLTEAYTLAERERKRRKEAILSTITTDVSAANVPLIHADAFDWIKTYDGPPFNFIHCDFPYGIGYQSHTGQTTHAKEAPRYDDSLKTYRKLVEELLPQLPIADSAHMFFWYSPKYYAYTVTMLISQGWKVHERPLIWGRGNSGIAPDYRRYPRNTYETALFCIRGDRNILTPVADSYLQPNVDKLHASAKPQDMLTHFFRMVVDGYTHMLDPTCGSGGAVRVAKELGAERVLGIERDEINWRRAVDDWNSRDKPLP